MTSATARLGVAAREPRAIAAISALTTAAQTVARVGIGALFVQHGLQKLAGTLGGFMGTAGATAPLLSMFGLAGVLELFGGILLIAGLATRPVALVLAAEMIAAYFIAHAPQGGWPIQNGGELPLLFASAFVLLAAVGAGKASIDAWISRRRADAWNS